MAGLRVVFGQDQAGLGRFAFSQNFCKFAKFVEWRSEGRGLFRASPRKEKVHFLVDFLSRKGAFVPPSAWRAKARLGRSRAAKIC